MSRKMQPQMGVEKNDQDDQASGDTVQKVCDMFNLGKKWKLKCFPLIKYLLDTLQMEKDSYAKHRRVSMHEKGIHDGM